MEGLTPSKTRKGKRPIWEEPVVEAPASLARMNERSTNRKSECDTTAKPQKCSGLALWKKGGRCMNRGWKNHERKKRTSKQKNARGNTRKKNTIGNETKQQDRMQTLPAEHLRTAEEPLGCSGMNNL
jgi:hypothetical protein